MVTTPRSTALKLIFCVMALFASGANRANADDNQDASVRSQMDEVYKAFLAIQPYLYNREAFLASENEKTISGLLTTLTDRFHKVEDLSPKHTREPGFAVTIKVLNDLLYDAKNRFNEGNKDYALWRMRPAQNYCVSCHTRFQDKKTFYDEQATLKGLSPLQQGEFFLATRQFERAKNSFLEAVRTDSQRMNALRGWLIVATRADPNPEEARQILAKLVSQVEFVPFERDEIDEWLTSLSTWSKASQAESKAPIADAEALIRKSSTGNAIGAPGAVDLLRASALLHKFLEQSTYVKPADRSRGLYLLGVAYNELQLFPVHEMSPLFLEQCIREFPGTADAKNAFKLYRELIILDFTGSAGTEVPDDVLLKLKELRDLSQGVPQPPARV
jgi:tetratricopeptide (TPR) repeat protein